MNTNDPAHEGMHQRLDALATAGTRGVELTRPDLPAPSRAWWRGTAGLALAAAAILAVAGTAVGLTAAGDDGDPVRTASGPTATESEPAPEGDDAPTVSVTPEPTTTAPPTTADPEEGQPVPTTPTPPPTEASPPPAAQAPAVVAVTYAGPTFESVPDVELTFVDATGAEIARRNLSETAGSGGGLIQRVPAGALQLRAVYGGGAGPICNTPYRAAASDRLILRLQPPGDESSEGCATIETVADWTAGHTGPTGESYVGLPRADADARAAAAGLTTRVVGLDGADLVVTMDLRTDRINFMMFDGVVAAAALDTE